MLRDGTQHRTLSSYQRAKENNCASEVPTHYDQIYNQTVILSNKLIKYKLKYSYTISIDKFGLGKSEIFKSNVIEIITTRKRESL